MTTRESKIKDGNFYVIQSFMVKDLKLKGLELSCFAIIYGFSQAEDQVFNGSLQYLCDWTCSSKQAVMTALKKLVDKNLLIKNDKFVNGVKFVEYQANNDGIQETCMGVYKKLDRGMQESCNNNISNKIKNNIDDKKINDKREIASKENNFDLKKRLEEAKKQLDYQEEQIDEQPGFFTRQLISVDYIQEDDLYIKDFNEFFNEMCYQYGFEVIRACVNYFTTRIKNNGVVDEFGNTINSRLSYCRIAIQSGADRLTKELPDNWLK